MSAHPYLRAYMAGIVVPTVLLLVMMTVFTFARYVYDISIPVERVIVFPMAILPNLWGAWNMLYVRLRAHRHFPIGVYGAIVPFLILPSAYAVTKLVGFEIPDFVFTAVPIIFPIMVIVYYLVWKHLVGFFNQTLGIA